MKKIFFLLACILFVLSMKGQYDRQNINLVGNWYNPNQVAEPIYGIKYNSVWGWVNPKTNVEYGILGSGSGTFIIDLSVPNKPKEAAYVAGKKSKCIWREYKTYKNYLYAISDDGSPNSFQIIDLSYLPDSVHVVHDGTDIFERAHTLFVDGDQLYVASVKESQVNGKTYSMAVYSLSNPEKPTLLRALNTDFPTIDAVHDMLVRNDTVYASCGNKGLFIYLYDKTANQFKAINSIEFYDNKGYNHSSALTPDGRTLVFCDEVPKNLPLKIADISDIHNISIQAYFRSVDGPTPHNPYMKGKSHVVVAYYQDGLQIFDVQNTKFPARTGYFDTDTLDGPANNYNPTGTAYHGNWGAYIDLPSGYILASDMQNGLFVLDADIALGISKNEQENPGIISVYPNPADGIATLQIAMPKAQPLTFEIVDITGRLLLRKTENEPAGIILETINLEAYDKGMYLIRISGKDTSYTTKLLKN